MAEVSLPAGGQTTGWTALSRGLWKEARSIFEQVLAAGENAEALEGLSWAAWWLDDAEAVFGARERAYLLYKKNRDPAGAARMATWLAADHLDFHGAATVASGWLRRAVRLLEPLERGPEHGWLAFFQGYVGHMSGDTSKARELGAQAADIGRTFDVPDLEMLGLALEGATQVACGEVEEGMRCLDEAGATALAGEARVPISNAWTCCFLVVACTSVFDYERAFEWCDRIEEFGERYGSRYMLAYCRAHYGAIHIWRGRWVDAERLLKSSIEDFSRSRPAWVEEPVVALAELRRLQGRDEDAVTLLDRAGGSAASQLCRARLALDGGEAGWAVELGDRLLRQLPQERRLDRAPVLELLVRARVLRGDLEEAASSLAELRDTARLVGTAPLKAFTDAAEGVLAAAAGEHARAQLLFEDALSCFESLRAPLQASSVRIELASSLVALARDDAAEREASTAYDRLIELGAPMLAERARRLQFKLRNRGLTGQMPQVTPREREVLSLLAGGLTNRQIAERLVVSEHTVHRHVTNLLRKLELPSRTAAAAFAVREGLVADGEG